MAKKKKARRTVAKTASPKIAKWEVQNAADTLIRANEIQTNRPLLRRAKGELKKRQKAITKVIKRK